MDVVTRFAPSPTGALHLGGARTALFNWVYARHYGGKFLLRVEDTDPLRSTQAFQEEILASLQWLGLDWDGPIVVQSKRKVRHQEVAYQLLATGKAYRCYTSAQELAALREKALQEGRPLGYDRRWREKEGIPLEDVPYVIRLKVPLTGFCVLKDGVQGEVTVDHESLDDMVLLRSDGTPTYMLAVVVDDHDMGVTHIIRGDDHLTNAFRQLQIYDALGWRPPFMFHIPLIHAMDGTKLSKRHGAISVSAYRSFGILSDALFNGLLRLGWSHGDEEKISRKQAVEWFDGSHLCKSAARLDDQKILALNAHYLRQQSPQDLWDLLARESLEEHSASMISSPQGLGDSTKGLLILEALAQRAKTLVELKASLLNYTHQNLPHIPALSKEEKDILTLFLQSLTERLSKDFWEQGPLESFLRSWAKEKNLSFSALVTPLRLALTGHKVSPSITQVMTALGQEWTLSRIQMSCEIGREGLTDPERSSG